MAFSGMCLRVLFRTLAILLLAGIFPVYGQSVSEQLYAEESGGLSPELQRVRTLIRANVLDLARELLESGAPPAVANPEWIAWERQLWALYRSQGDWESLYQRTREIPPGFPAEFRQEAAFQAVEAHINLGNGAAARINLRKLLTATGLTDVDQRKVRRLVVESYLADDLLPDAGSSMARYQLDFRSQDPEWLMLSAQVYLQLGDYDTAINLLAPVDSERARLLLIFARLQNQSITPSKAMDWLTGMLEQNDSSRAQISDGQILTLMVFAGIRIPDYLAAQSYLETLLGQGDRSRVSLDRAFPHYTLENLLQVYAHIAMDSANSVGILLGEEDRLFDHAVQLPPAQSSTKKAIYGYLLQVVEDPVFRVQLNNFYIEALLQSNELGVIPILYGAGNPFGELQLSGNVGLGVSNAALELGLIDLAAMASENLSETPAGMAYDQWQLHVARISIFAGNYAKGAAELHEWLLRTPDLTLDQIDQILQPVFDLQTVGQHDLALGLLLEIRNRISSPRHTREIAYWIAESYKANRQYILAAEHFLYSALLQDNGLDQWGEAARFQAAESLQSANLVKDSRALYEGILSRTDDENRTLQIEQKLQELILLESSLALD